MSVFEILREQVPLDRVVSANAAGKAHCAAPDHQDANPSMRVYDRRVHCFACGFHGDVADVWAAVKGLEPGIEAALDLAREFGVELPRRDPEARRKDQERRDKEDSHLEQARACHEAL